jgi:hypothetical protein
MNSADWRAPPCAKIPRMSGLDSLPRYVELIVALVKIILVDPVGAVTVTVLFAACGGSQNPQAVNRVVIWLTHGVLSPVPADVKVLRITPIPSQW